MSKFIKYIIVVIWGYFIRLSLTFILTDFLKIWYLWSYSLTMLLLILIGFYYHFNFTFKNAKNKKNKFIIYAVAVIFFTLVDVYFVRILSDVFQIYYLFSIILSNSLFFIIKFIFYKEIVFIDYKTKGGNYFNKHKSKNPIIKYLLKKFHENIFKFIHRTRSRTLLDAGCGEGYTTEVIQKKFSKLKIKAIELDKFIVQKGIQNKGFKIEKGDIYNIPFKNHSFDVVLASEVLEHLEYPNKAVKECKRVSRKYCIFSVPNEHLWRIANILRLSYLSRLGNTPGHIQNWTKKGFEKLLNKHFKHVIIKKSILWNIALCWD